MPTNNNVKVASRFFVYTKIPHVKNIDIKFVYNYFVPDEATNDTGIPSYDPGFYSGGTVSGNSYFVDSDGNKMMQAPDGSVTSASDVLMRNPRQVELFWVPPVTKEDLPKSDNFDPVMSIQEAVNNEVIVNEEDIRSVLDTSVKYFDPRLSRRLTDKSLLMMELCGKDPYSANAKIHFDQIIEESDLSSLYDEEMKSNAGKLFDANVAEGVRRVNELTPEDPIPAFSSAQSTLFESYIDRRMIKDAADSMVARFNFDRQYAEEYYSLDEAQRSRLPEEGSPSLKTVHEGALRKDETRYQTPILPAWLIGEEGSAGSLTTSVNFSMIKLVGYIVNRYDKSITDLNNPTKIFYVETSVYDAPNVIDTEIVYGKEYYYSVRAVYCREFYDLDSSTMKMRRMQQWFASKPSEPLLKKTVEVVPPIEPDGLFYKFNYGKRRGLVLTWQYPSERTRDTKYFQVFRRKTIKDPFTCIAEIDFNDSHIPYPRREHVEKSKVFKYKHVVTHFEDIEFTRDSEYIYAVASIDAHGLTSGYSHQTKVKFNRARNEIELTGISRSGAPKQYPNFFVDPDMDETTFVRTFTQDCMKSSGKTKVKIYFMPDCEIYETFMGKKASGESIYESKTNLGLASSDVETIYKLHLINTDRQKDDSVEIRVSDFRGVEVFPQE